MVKWRRSPLPKQLVASRTDACPEYIQYRSRSHKLVWHHSGRYIMTEHDHRAAGRRPKSSMRVNMVNIRAASHGGERGRVIAGYASGARPRTVRHSALDGVRPRSCTAVRAPSAKTLRVTSAHFLLAVLIALRRESNSGTQRNALSAAISFSCLGYEHSEQEVRRGASPRACGKVNYLLSGGAQVETEGPTVVGGPSSHEVEDS